MCVTKKVKSRKSISIRGDSYRKVKEHCISSGVTISSWLEEQIALFFQSLPQTNDEIKPPKENPPQEEPESHTEDVQTDEEENTLSSEPWRYKYLQKETPPKTDPPKIRGGGIHMF